MKTSTAHLRRRLLSSVVPVAVLTASLLAAGCAVKPEPLTAEENLARVRKDLSVVLAPQEPLTKAVSMDEAMARAIKYNLDERVKLMEVAVATDQLDLSRYDMLPRVVAAAGYVGRNNDAGSESLNLATGRRTGESTTATDKHRRTADLAFTWNVLDFGVSYLRARQNANLVLIADERRRRVVQGIMQDVRTAYWRAVAAERLLKRLEPLEKRVEGARRDARKLEAMRIQAPLQALNYTRSLVETLRQLQSLRRELVAAKSQLGALMGLPPGEPFEIEMPAASVMQAPPKLDIGTGALETYALLNRPELLEESYNQRISADETWRSLLKLLPGIDVNAALRYDSNSFLLNQRWADYGARISWNLINLVSAPATKSYAEAQEELVAFRRQALSMAVLSQVHVAVLQFRELKQEFALTAEQADLDTRIRAQYANSGEAGQVGELGVIQSEVTALLSDLRRDLVLADLHNAYARVMVSAGVDPLPETMAANDLPTLTQAVGKGLSSWQERANNVLRVKDLMAEPKAAAKDSKTQAATPEPVRPDAPKQEPALQAVPVAAAPVPEPTPAAPAPADPAPAATPFVLASAAPTPVPAPVPMAAPAPAPAENPAPIAAPVATASFSPVIQADLGAYASHRLAAREWGMITGRLGTEGNGVGALYATTRRSQDGKIIVQLRAGGFADRAAAERFCHRVKDSQRECTVRTLSAQEQQSDSQPVDRLASL
ncbi:Outer membrane protein TolC [Azospirillum oryzae]|uniref:Outer membrane protein TolC n=1 Tax=Azospirillum oryzae TaxID=286727 RepID=A0A1X7EYE3_9PROT|nr:TolC family protein [Azospirillum oryzae]SMF42466.1 Outer membrane protein TolC [Azospirillum oryzae]